jgi:HEAT repeat protein
MSQLAVLLQEYYERSPYRSVAELARSARQHAALSDSYLKNLLQGRRLNPAYDKLMAVALALGLNQADTTRLLEAAGLPATPAHDPQIQRVTAALHALADTPGISTSTVGAVVDGVLLMIEGFKASLDASATLSPIASEAAVSLRNLPAGRLSQEESVIDDLLGEILARGETHPLSSLFQSLQEAAQGDSWEVKRRISEALPRLVQLEPQATLQLASILRLDYHPDYRADIRRRVIEAVPALYAHRPQDTLALLPPRAQDEVYTAMAAVEALFDMQQNGLITSETAQQYTGVMQLDDPLHQEVVNYLHQMLEQIPGAPEKVLASLGVHRSHPERIFRICVQRITPRLLPILPDPVLELMLYFLRRDESDQPAEHQNLRRPVSRALPEILRLFDKAPSSRREQIERILQALAQDPDIHVRRALGDALDILAMVSSEVLVNTLDKLIMDQDPYVRQRAWRALVQLADLYPEQAAGYYARLLTPVS